MSLVVIVIALWAAAVPGEAAFHTTNPISIMPQHPAPLTPRSNWVVDLWEEIIEFSTLGPGERKMLAARRKEKERELSAESFSEARRKLKSGERNDDPVLATEGSGGEDDSGDDLSPAAFRAAAAVTTKAAQGVPSDFDGYALRDLIVERWGANLDVDFQRQPSCVYCTILPVAFGQKKCRHESELAYLMHLQGVIEVLREYDNLEPFMDFIKTTSKIPRAGTDSVPFRLQLSDEQLRKILQNA